MKVLLFGEFSGLHNNLKDGLLELGHDVVIAAGKDSYKDIQNDLNLDPTLPGLLGKIQGRARTLFALYKLKKYDVVQTINPFYPNYKYFPKRLFYKILSNRNGRFFMLAAGSDAYYWRNGRRRLRYGPFDDFLKYDVKSHEFYMERECEYKYNKKIVDLSNGVIPIMYEYEASYYGCSKLLNTIPMPINIKKIEYSDNVVGKKLVVFHGISRYGFKGTRHVEEAFEILEKKYPDKLELIIDGQMPLEQYLKLMRKTNIVIDQVNTQSIGMNGLYALAMGKVVLGGAEPESLASLRVSKTPVINVLPSANSIVEEIEKLLVNVHLISEMGKESRYFAENVHGHVSVAKRYIEAWGF